MEMLLTLIILLLFFTYVIWELRKSNQKEFLEYKKMYPKKTDQEIRHLMKEEFFQKEKEYYHDHEGW